MSPFFFVLSMEVLSQLLNKAAIVGVISYHPRCAKVKLIHFCFADNLIIFYAATSGSFNSIKHITDKFYTLSGLEVSYPESEFFSSGVSSNLQHHLAFLSWS